MASTLHFDSMNPWHGIRNIESGQEWRWLKFCTWHCFFQHWFFLWVLSGWQLKNYCPINFHNAINLTKVWRIKIVVSTWFPRSWNSGNLEWWSAGLPEARLPLYFDLGSPLAILPILRLPDLLSAPEQEDSPSFQYSSIPTFHLVLCAILFQWYSLEDNSASILHNCKLQVENH